MLPGDDQKPSVQVSLGAQLCLACFGVLEEGYPLAGGASYICADCTSELLMAFCAAHHLDIVPFPGPDDLCVQITFRPGDDPACAEVQILPEPLDAPRELWCLALAAVRLDTYRAHYSAARRAEEEWSSL